MALVVFAVMVVALAIVEFGPSWLRRRGTRGRRGTRERVEADGQPAALGQVGSDEAALVEQLLTGTISSARYQMLMADLAARDAQAHPLVVPRPPGWPPPV